MSNQKNLQFRDLIRSLVPPWLSDKGPLSKSNGFKFLFSGGATLDAIMQWFTEGAQARMPGVGTFTALGKTASDRGFAIPPFYGPGSIEPVWDGNGGTDFGPASRSQVFIQGLINWLSVWKRAGHGFTILEQIRQFLGPVKCRIVDRRGNWYTIDEDGTRTLRHNWEFVPGTVWAWYPPETGKWVHFWVIIYAPPDWEVWQKFHDDNDYWLWDGTLGSSGPTGRFMSIYDKSSDPALLDPMDGTIGQLKTDPDYVLGDLPWFPATQRFKKLNGEVPYPTWQAADFIRALVKKWKPAHAKCDKIIIAFDPASFDPDDSSTYPTDGTWGKWTKGSPAVESRNPTARYWEGID